MTRIVHLSDLHFGFHRAELVAPLLDRVNGARADLVVVTGDLTHRARPAQFRVARDFLARIEAPVMTVAGNHDVPLVNVLARIMTPFRGYRRFAGGLLAPCRDVGPVRVMGLNSVDPRAAQAGLVRRADLDRLVSGMKGTAMTVVALHHPLEHLLAVDKTLARGAPEALARLAQAGAQVVLSGHLHVWATDALLAQTAHPGVLQIQGGTALCARPSDRQNEFAVLDIDGPGIRIERHIAPMGETGFRPPVHERFTRAHGFWRAHQPPEMPVIPG